jgi:hypothetical protein
MGIFPQTTASFCKNLIITLVFEKNALASYNAGVVAVNSKVVGSASGGFSKKFFFFLKTL